MSGFFRKIALIVLVMLLGMLFFFFSFQKKMEQTPEIPKKTLVIPEGPSEDVTIIPAPGMETPRKVPKKPSPVPKPAPLSPVGSGEVFDSKDLPGRVSPKEVAQNLNKPEKKEDLLSKKDLGKLGDVVESVQDAKDSVEEELLRGGKKVINAIPLVYAEPDEAKLEYSGGTVSVKFSIPVERLRLGNPLKPEKIEVSGDLSKDKTQDDKK